MTRLRLLVVDAHALFRRGLRHLFADPQVALEIELVAEAHSLTEALHRLERAPADVAVVDGRLPDGSGIDFVRTAARRWPDLHVIVLGSERDTLAVSTVFAAGAAGYLLKSVTETDLLQALRTVRDGGLAIDPSLTSLMVNWVTRQRDAGGDPALLTERQERILHLIGQGLSNRDIAGRLGIAEKTVKNHVTQLLQRLGLSSRTEAALYVTRTDTSPGPGLGTLAAH